MTCYSIAMRLDHVMIRIAGSANPCREWRWAQLRRITNLVGCNIDQFKLHPRSPPQLLWFFTTMSALPQCPICLLNFGGFPELTLHLKLFHRCKTLFHILCHYLLSRHLLSIPVLKPKQLKAYVQYALFYIEHPDSSWNTRKVSWPSAPL